jgi:hypothetical protein
MKRRTMVTVVVVLIGLIALLFIPRTFQLQWIGVPGLPTVSSPIVVRGGSIHGNLRSTLRNWNRIAKGTKYSAAYSSDPTKIDYISVNYFDGGLTSPMTGTGGWIIAFTNSDSQGNPVPSTLSLCSYDCSSDPNPSLDSDGQAYLVITDSSKAALEEYYDSLWRDQLHFHYIVKGCDEQYSAGDRTENGTCDRIMSITIRTKNNVQGTDGKTSYHCQVPKGCYVQIGPS